MGDKVLVADMSSNFCSKPVDVSKYGLIYAGAQKVRVAEPRSQVVPCQAGRAGPCALYRQAWQCMGVAP